jgi:hypothetical protein
MLGPGIEINKYIIENYTPNFQQDIRNQGNALRY